MKANESEDNSVNKKAKSRVIKFILRTFIIWIGQVIGFIIIADISVGLTINNWATGLIVVGILGIINALFWPILSRYFLPFLIYTVGIGSLLINGLIIWLISNFIPGITIHGWALILTPLAMALITTLLSAVITMEDESSYYRVVLRRYIRKRKAKTKNYPGVIFLEIDGLSEVILKEALEKGHMPTLKRWLEAKTHQIMSWETDLSSQTGASQAGILHGNNYNLPAFRWVEKVNNNKIMVSSGLSDAPLIEKRISNGKGLLSLNGASISNLFSGDAGSIIFTYSKLKNLHNFYDKTFYYFYSNPSNFARIVILYFFDVIMDFGSQLTHWLKNKTPRIHRGFVYPFIRAGANVFLREITTYILIGDILASDIDIAYSTYLGYDEIAHHSGIRDFDAFYALRGVDQQFKRLENVLEYTDRPYYFVVQSDHGQSNGATFKQRYKMSLEDLVRSLIPEELTIYSKLSSNEDHFGQLITNPIDNTKTYFKDKKDTAIEKSRKLRDNTLENIEKSPFAKGKVLEYIQDYKISKKSSKKTSEEAEVIVLASGNLGLVYLTSWKERLTYEQIKIIFPDLIPGLVQHEGIKFIMVQSQKWGPLVLGKEGINYLEYDEIEGKNPLEDFGENTAQHLLKTDKFDYVPDILVNSFYDPETDEVAAFEELVGSHGGLGGGQSRPFIMYPSAWNIDKEIVGAESLHKILKKKLIEISKTTPK